MELSGQIYTFAVTVLTGAFLGILFDFYRVMRGLFRPRAAITMVADFFYWLVATAVVLLSLLTCNWLELRLYVFLGLIGGAAAYFRLLSRYAIYLLIKLMRLVAWLVDGCRKIVFYVVIRPVMLVLKLLLLPFTKARGPVVSLWRKVTALRTPQDTPPPP